MIASPKIAFVFSGQGAQYPGMGKDLYEQSGIARQVFDHAERLMPGVQEICFAGTKEDLSQTINTQPCLLAVDLAAARVLQSLGVEPSMVAGFSLGELAALAVGGVFSDEVALELVMRRAQLMDFAAQAQPGMMAAVLGHGAYEVQEYVNRYPNVIIANYNCATQQVVSGATDEVKQLVSELKAARIKVIPLAVSGGFHSPLMEGASEQFGRVLEHAQFAKPALPVYANVTAQPYPEKRDDIKHLLAQQIASSVKWEQTMLAMLESGVTTIVECGAGKVLSGLAKKIVPEFDVYNVETYEDALQVADALKGQVDRG